MQKEGEFQWNQHTIVPSDSFHILFFYEVIYLFLERGEGKEKKREKNTDVWLPLVRPQLGTWPTTRARALTGNQTSNPLVCRPVLNPLSHTNHGSFYILSEKRNKVIK